VLRRLQSVYLRYVDRNGRQGDAKSGNLRRAFARDLLRAAPDVLVWAVRRDSAARTRIKRTLGIEAIFPARPLDARALKPGAAHRGKGPVTIIMPVHNAYDHLRKALERVARHTDLPWHLVLIDDASSDLRVRPFLRAWTATHRRRVTLIEQAQNRGFVASVNRALVTVRGRAGPVILLNSDAMVPQDWASRLIAPLQKDASVASVTPMSNNAEIFSVPVMGCAVDLPQDAVDRIDAVAEALSPSRALPDAPTGVGFCMALSRDWLARVPGFDPAFSPGYGEEVDWCQKTRRLGARHVGLPGLFVEHLGEQSFGAKRKRERVSRTNDMIAGRYPGYDAEVQRFIRDDPLLTARMALGTALAGEQGELPVYLAHSLGGGAEQALQSTIEGRTQRGGYAMVLRVGGPTRWRLELCGPGGVLSAATDDLTLVQRLLAPVPRLRIIYSCGVGDKDPVALPELLLSLKRSDKVDRVEVLMHDYFPLSPSYTLLDSEGHFHGAVLDGADKAHQAQRPDGLPVALRQWRVAWGKLMDQADCITVFSESSRALLCAAYPGAGAKLTCRPHDLGVAINPVPAPDGPFRLGILGNLNLQKGAQVAVDLSARLTQFGYGDAVLLGNLDPRFAPPSGLHLHGGYDRAEISTLAPRYGLSAWLIPSIWPETFSFTTHEALATGLPVYGFDLGAQGEALTVAPNGHAVPFEPDADLAAAVLAAICAAQTGAAAA